MTVASNHKKNPRILIVTPEITYLPSGMGNMADILNAKAGGLADVSASLVAELYGLGADVHVALPHYRRMFHMDVGRLISDELRVYNTRLADARIHLAEDRCFYYRDTVYSNYSEENPRLALSFQREVINNIIPSVNPDLIHCNDWMTGLIPAAARRMGIPCLFTVHNIHTQKLLLSRVEDAGIDAAEFWPLLYFSRMPYNYEETRDTNPVDMLASGVFAAHFINTVSPTFLAEIAQGRHDFVPGELREQITNKINAGCAEGILNAPDTSYNPATDSAIERRYTPEDAFAAKRENKVAFQRKVGLEVDPDAPLFFWPSRLDPMQKGPQLLTDILFRVIGAFASEKLQVAVVANGSHQAAFHRVASMHDMNGRVAICDFEESLSRLGYAGSDFTLMPSRFEPCGLPQMIGTIYGSMPIVHDTGGLHDTVEHFNAESCTGNGFVFRDYDSNGLFWAIGQAMEFYRLPREKRAEQISRVMRYGLARFNHKVCAKAYIDIYERMLQRPLLNPLDEPEAKGRHAAKRPRRQ